MAPVEGRAYCQGGEEGECGGRGALRLLRLLAAGQVHPPTDPLRHHTFLQGQSQEMRHFRLHLSKSGKELNSLYPLCVQNTNTPLYSAHHKFAPFLLTSVVEPEPEP